MAPTRVAACHVASHFLSAQKSVDKAISLIHQAAKNSANLVVFPETYLSAFPIWSAIRPPTENHDLFHRMVQESLYADGEEVRLLQEAARETKTVISMGFSEKYRASTACLYNSNLIINTMGEVAVHHRKLMPTFFEKLTWSPGDGYGLRVADTPYGRVGGLICGENTNPLARYSLMAQREQIHISSWPPIWPTRVPASSPKEKEKEEGDRLSQGQGQGQGQAPANYDNVLANRLRAAAHCFEAKCFGVMCSGFLGQDAIDIIVSGSRSPGHVKGVLDNSPRGVSMFLDPTGTPLPSFTVEEDTKTQRPKEFLQNEEGVLYADMDLDRCIEGKQYHDVVGGYQRLDVFQLQVNRSRRDPVVFTEGSDIEEL
ncbi:carbon-nitrogen hydrolase family protein [Aspergillus affinis]|uniref:carbon-nitrogen hydrolase family protein n=1 Tax=Aspergillus affinis TaxID=1070780 RepID=UPI0022FEF5C1|nr:uncharacterized protein KD926_006060 [Aspergillus affinis]KAI9042141.1 hypothetical protein KD926_006060 [Aspergillus affinis]